MSALVMALCYSRYLYIEFTLSQTFGALVRGMERGLAFFGVTTVVDIFDNMKTVVIANNHKTTQFNHKFLACSRARDFGIRACNSGKGNEKGRVERPIGFMRERFWPGRRFISLLDLNQQATALARRLRQQSRARRDRQDPGAGLQVRGATALASAVRDVGLRN